MRAVRWRKSRRLTLSPGRVRNGGVAVRIFCGQLERISLRLQGRYDEIAAIHLGVTRQNQDPFLVWECPAKMEKSETN